MATVFDPTFESESHHGGRVRKTTAGKFVAERSTAGKLRRKTFSKKKEAIDHLKKDGAARDKHGHIAMALTGGEMKQAADALQKLQGRASLTMAVDFWIKHHPADCEIWTVKETHDRYIEEMQTPTDGGSPARPETIDTKKKRLRTFLKFHGEQPVSEITPEDVTAWINSFKNHAPRTVLNHRAELQSLFNFAENHLPQFENIVCKVKQRKKHETAPADILTPQQAEGVLRWLENNAPDRYALTFALMLFAGIRPLELTRPGTTFDWGCIRLDEGQILVPATTSKTRTFREVPITDNLRKWITRYPGSGRVCPAENRFRAKRLEACTKLGITWVPDMPRHSFGSYAGELHGLHKAAGWMGHSGGLGVFNAHYKGRSTPEQARAFFNITPTPEAGGKLIQINKAG
ncbi:phage integrase N-terminal SAM-like domain-containing protein [Kiritimatiellota bacterium B12222]|nr:phage integrase N-terminal SAM-like domain-containing protein [Kiritimatiellota bacterium B12222]